MSASLVPTLDRENAGAHLGTHDKHHLIGSQKKRGELQTRPLPVQKPFGGTSLNLQKSHRSFGEISNRLDRGSETTHSGIFKEKLNHPPLSTASIPEGLQKEVSEESEFILSIPEVQDYSDIFPSSLHMSHNQLKKFAHFWESCQKPDLHKLNSKISSSPPRDLTQLPFVKYDEKVILEPVPEDLFHLPPPWE